MGDRVDGDEIREGQDRGSISERTFSRASNKARWILRPGSDLSGRGSSHILTVSNRFASMIDWLRDCLR